MYIDWVITLSVIILVLTCVFLGYGVYFAVKKIHQSDVQGDGVGELKRADPHLIDKRA